MDSLIRERMPHLVHVNKKYEQKSWKSRFDEKNMSAAQEGSDAYVDAAQCFATVTNWFLSS